MTTTRSVWISRRNRSLCTFAATTLTLAASLALAQQPLAQPPANPIRQALAFEVASIHPHQGPLQRIMDFSSSGPRVRLEGYNLRALIMEAYNIRNFQVSATGIDEQQNTFYDIVANAPEGTAPTRDEFRLMLQSLLADRLQLKAHIEKRSMPVYALVVGKGGSKLNSPSEAGHGLHGVNGRNQFLDADSITMDDLANEIWSGFMPDRPVIDRTGLTGTYKLRIEATPEWRINGNPQPDDLSIFTAVQEQLGLKLEPTTAPVDILVIDSVQKPSEN
ncbi:MAG TPA: TIGR03435 family protein [Acidobacteriaceae bacterium]|jgi:uncharacterized protein (TIGR03435 family)|nr:TIGR03435 family protein [Acidobacteriaceae bacterium]